MNYKNAFQCQKCPESNKEDGCPCWVGDVVETHLVTGEIKVISECLFRSIPRWFTHAIQAGNRPAAAFESMRNEIVSAIWQEKSEIVQAIEQVGEKQRLLD